MKTSMKIERPNARYYKDIWLELFDGGSDEWLWVVRNGMAYIFIRIIDLPAACGREATERWAADVAVVDLATISIKSLVNAVQCCGAENDPPSMKTEEGRLTMAEMCFQYGAKAPMWNAMDGKISDPHECGNENDRAFRSLRKQAREEAEKLFDQGA